MPKLSISERKVRRQNDFNFIVGKLMEQGMASTDLTGGGACLYRADKIGECERKCAIGWLIPDELYKAEWDRTDQPAEVMKEILGVLGRLEDLTFYRAIQSELHDMWASVSDFKKGVKSGAESIARRYELELPDAVK